MGYCGRPCQQLSSFLGLGADAGFGIDVQPLLKLSQPFSGLTVGLYSSLRPGKAHCVFRTDGRSVGFVWRTSWHSWTASAAYRVRGLAVGFAVEGERQWASGNKQLPASCIGQQVDSVF